MFARIRGRASSMVTLRPARTQAVANSRPMAPPPMIMTSAGKAANPARNWSESTATASSAPSMGGMDGREPVARMMWSAVKRVPSEQTTVPGSGTDARARTRVAWDCRSILSAPVRSMVTIWSALSRAAAVSNPAPRPRSRAFVGIQPRLRHVPPIWASSTRTTDCPWRKASFTAFMPPGPPPRTAI